jgi:hypothetical protein
VKRWSVPLVVVAAGLAPWGWRAASGAIANQSADLRPQVVASEAPAEKSSAHPPAITSDDATAAAEVKPPSPTTEPTTDEFAEIPDLTQTDPELRLRGGGNSYCGPVAVSNSLMWLGRDRCPGLIPDGENPKQQQIELVHQLSSNRYMGTSWKSGTGGIGLLRGLHRYLVHHGCAYRRLRYQGWRGHPREFTSRVKVPDLDWIRSGVERGGAAWINVGWYQQSEGGRAFRRHGGHWLTVVAPGRNGAALILHDPAPYAGTDFANESVNAERIESGWLIEQKAAFPARGYYRLAGGMHVKREGEIAILDGAVVLEL